MATTHRFTELKEQIIQEFRNYKNEDVGYDNYDFTTEDGVEEFLEEHTNREWSFDNYFADDIIDWEYDEETGGMSASLYVDCMNYINEGYNDMIGEDIPINMINSKDKLKRQMIYWIGQEIKEQLLGHNDGLDDLFVGNLHNDDDDDDGDLYDTEDTIDYEDDSDYEDEPN